MNKIHCPICNNEQKQKPKKSWTYGKMIESRTTEGTTWGASVNCSNYECKCGQTFRYYLTAKGKSWTIPKRKIKEDLELKLEKYTVLSLAGSHAKESFNKILQRKIKDIESVGFTFWVENSPKSLPDYVQSFYNKSHEQNIKLNCLLYAGSKKGKGAKDTKTTTRAKEYSKDKKIWEKIDPRLSPITGNFNINSHALVFDKLESVSNLELNLENYIEFNTREPIRNNLVASTFCSEKKSDNIEAKKPNNIREIYAVGRIHPFSSVWVR